VSQPERSVRLGVLAAPGLPEDVTARIADDPAEDLRIAYGTLGWRTEFVVDRLAIPPASLIELVDAPTRPSTRSSADSNSRVGGKRRLEHVVTISTEMEAAGSNAANFRSTEGS
jgi:hypothetical protein